MESKKRVFVIVNANTGKVWSGGSFTPFVNIGRYCMRWNALEHSIAQLSSAIDNTHGWTSEGQKKRSAVKEYTTLAGARKCPAWRFFKQVPQCYIEERVYVVAGKKFHDMSSVKVER